MYTVVSRFGKVSNMKNLKGNIIWGMLLLGWILMLSIEGSRHLFIEVTEAHPYVGGFVKFSILATMGDILGARIMNGSWKLPQGMIAKACVWGILGIMITLVFSVYVAGAAAVQSAGKLPFAGSRLALAFFASTIMNLTFGPMLYIYHKFGDLFIDMSIEKRRGNLPEGITVVGMVSRVDWLSMVGFSWLKTCLFVWIPAHTLVFMLPEQFRVLASAFLSILLGIIVAIAKKEKKPSANEQTA